MCGRARACVRMWVGGGVDGWLGGWERGRRVGENVITPKLAIWMAFLPCELAGLLHHGSSQPIIRNLETKVKCSHHKQDDTSHQYSVGLLWLLHAEAASRAQKVDKWGCSMEFVLVTQFFADHCVLITTKTHIKQGPQAIPTTQGL